VEAFGMSRGPLEFTDFYQRKFRDLVRALRLLRAAPSRKGAVPWYPAAFGLARDRPIGASASVGHGRTVEVLEVDPLLLRA